MKQANSRYAVSTVAFGKASKEQVVTLATAQDWAIEFSSGFAPDPEMIPFYKKQSLTRYPHNYFPAPADPFVMNLASKNEQIRSRSTEHCLLGLELAKASGSPWYSAHAGFCIDPRPDQLGNPLDIHQDYDREEHWDLFMESLDKVLKKADELEIDFLIENNVLAPFNHIDSTVPVLLCVDAPEMIRLIEVKDHPRLGILLDTAHLKVSAQTLGFDMYDHAELVSPFVEVIHHSDNDGLADTNQVLGEDYWAKSTGALFHGCLHVLEVKNIDTGVINQQLALLQGIYG